MAAIGVNDSEATADLVRQLKAQQLNKPMAGFCLWRQINPRAAVALSNLQSWFDASDIGDIGKNAWKSRHCFLLLPNNSFSSSIWRRVICRTSISSSRRLCAWGRSLAIRVRSCSRFS
ncbi:hypothetical protein F4V91_13410 [Neorhizobium galegae]|uniref:Uncharacterized protein n=1 Tax=Neorhizobium galegae TaxID=399 RepID=A0A6A1TR72_NEOGA|nr:hypothetical protein [Neorhizobium galegae]KAB1087331.1 hypothetical protein F4V91_13410 [Neorhizobium galegae]